MKIIENKIQCKRCKEILISENTHDFKMCRCRKVGIDGGTTYLRRIGNPEDIIDMSIIDKSKGVKHVKTKTKRRTMEKI